MISIFVITDNPIQYRRVREIISSKEDVSATYFCSPNSDSLFSHEISKGEISMIDLKINSSSLYKYDVGFSIHSKQIFPKGLVDSVRCINVHPGYNPVNRGWYPQVFSLLNGSNGGATIHLMDAEIDHGPILVQERVHALSTDTSKDFYERILDCEIRLFEENFEKFVSAGYCGQKVECEGNYNSIKDFKDMCQIDLDEVTTFKEAINKLRALTHPPYKNAFFIDSEGKKIYLELKLLSDVSSDKS